jgi:hypothetical protein
MNQKLITGFLTFLIITAVTSVLLIFLLIIGFGDLRSVATRDHVGSMTQIFNLA